MITVADNNGIRMKDFDENGNVGRFRYIGISQKQWEAFISDPTVPTTFTGGSYTFLKDYISESETRTIIKLTVSKSE